MHENTDLHIKTMQIEAGLNINQIKSIQTASEKYSTWNTQRSLSR